MLGSGLYLCELLNERFARPPHVEGLVHCGVCTIAFHSSRAYPSLIAGLHTHMLLLHVNV
jgi:hypothetical protein